MRPTIGVLAPIPAFYIFLLQVDSILVSNLRQDTFEALAFRIEMAMTMTIRESEIQRETLPVSLVVHSLSIRHDGPGLHSSEIQPVPPKESFVKCRQNAFVAEIPARKSCLQIKSIQIYDRSGSGSSWRYKSN